MRRTLFCGFMLSIALFASSCSDSNDNDTARPPAAQTEGACDDLAAARRDLDKMEAAIARGDASGAQAALDDARTKLREVRSDVGAQANNNASQAAADLVGAVDGLQTTMRQTGQGGGSIQGVVQQLEIQLMSMSSSFKELQSQMSCS